MAFAIIRTGGKQFHVQPGMTVRVPSLASKKEGDSVEFEVLALGGDNDFSFGSAVSSPVTGTVVGHGRDTKIIVFKKKRRKQYKRTQGHRQGFTAVKIDSIG